MLLWRCTRSSFSVCRAALSGNNDIGAAQQTIKRPLVKQTRSKFLDARDRDHHEKEKSLMLHHKEMFEEVVRKERNKKTYQKAVNKYLQHQGVQRRGHVEFIYAAIDQMKAFQVEKDIAVYKQIIGLFPRDKMVASNMWQMELMHYPKQQQCLIDVLDKMESHGVIPDDDIGYEIIKIFGKNTYPFRKYQRMMYWMPKFKYANPYYIPYNLPDDPIELAKMALKRMSVDLENKISVYFSSDLENAVDDTFIVSAQSAAQRELILDHPADVPLFVEGGFLTWLREKSLYYFVLKCGRTKRHKLFTENLQDSSKEHQEDKFKFTLFEEETSAVVVKPTVHEQAEGTVLGMCITGTSSKDSLASWIKSLQEQNPRLADTPVVFLLQTPETGLQSFSQDTNTTEVTPHDSIH